jgi:hypothetical protein
VPGLLLRALLGELLGGLLDNTLLLLFMDVLGGELGLLGELLGEIF